MLLQSTYQSRIGLLLGLLSGFGIEMACHCSLATTNITSHATTHSLGLGLLLSLRTACNPSFFWMPSIPGAFPLYLLCKFLSCFWMISSFDFAQPFFLLFPLVLLFFESRLLGTLQATLPASLQLRWCCHPLGPWTTPGL